MSDNFGAGADGDEPPVELGEDTPALDKLLHLGSVATSGSAPLGGVSSADVGSSAGSASSLDPVAVPPPPELNADEQFLRDIGHG